MNNRSDELLEAAKYAFIDQRTEQNIQVQLQPQLLTNQADTSVLDYLIEEMKTSKSFTFAVAFVTESGLIDLKSTLLDMATRGIKGRLITSIYLNFNNPKVFRELLKIENLEVRLADVDGFHTKTYLFEHQDYLSMIIGSSNLTQNALKKNVEWNLRVTSMQQGDIVYQVTNGLENIWENAIPLTQKWIDDYASTYIMPQSNAHTHFNSIAKTNLKTVQPNAMQKKALAKLSALRSSGASKGLVVAATGTGKTYLAALDVKQTGPKRLLFVVHREQILVKAIESFKLVLGGSEHDYGILSGHTQDSDAKYLFATINMVSKDGFLNQIAEDAFDYIIIDEAHRIGTSQDKTSMTMYQRFLNHFTPQFLLGMTATPERTDGADIYQYFDYNLAYEISLLDALGADLLAPFHYIGVTDYTLDGEVMEEGSVLTNLATDERVTHLLKKTHYYGYSGDTLYGLIFVSQIEQGKALATALTNRGVPAKFLSGKDSIETRKKVVSELEESEIQYIITVDVFNEGIDIPKVNQVVMMRPTISSIIFLQQLGRGLRKSGNKEYVTVLDFIGNYQNNFMIPMAFDKSNTSDKEKLRKNIVAPVINGVSTINFEEIAAKRILESIRAAKLNSVSIFREAYLNVKQKIGNRVPFLLDILSLGSISIHDLIEQFDSLYAMQAKFEDVNTVLPTFTDEKCKMLNFIYKEVVNSKRIIDVVTLKMLIDKSQLTDEQLLANFDLNNYFYDDDSLMSLEKMLTLEYYLSGTLKKYGDTSLITRTGNLWELSGEFKLALADVNFHKYVDDALAATKLDLEHNYDLTQRFQIGEKYYRKDAIRLLNWEKEQTGQNVGGYIKSKNNRFLPMFVNLEKITATNLVPYEDRFINNDTMIWYSKSKRTLISPTEKIISATDKYGFIQVFVKRSDEVTKDGKSFYYLGSAKVINTEEVVVKDINDKETNLLKWELKLQQPISHSLFQALL
ncbi:DEAD/DEAH box helicase [Periweissella fabaria]|uniref:ATP-dependent RNA helicase SrmB n=1 Tax=Periweissella fabaria TaxID=546157 RepID=A0ABM8Z3T8_9LACO|nr:DEAD/DEAH box helicase [Periweissella fabaria]MCM0597494.1 DEAD/DEAH box helicase [Periweissella fabaria]CAH0416004.1 ATP-dependent RNA helicase SrmB [Periweissella fabaria]